MAHYCCSVTQLCLTLCNPMDCSMPGFPVLHHLPKLAQTHVHWISDAIQPSHPLSSPFPPALSLSQHQGLFQWVSSLHQVAKVLELQPRHQSFQCISGVDFLRVCLFYHCFLEFAQTNVHWISDAIQPSHPLLSPSPLALNLSQHQGLFQWISSLHQVAKVLEIQLQSQSFQWIFRIDFL